MPLSVYVHIPFCSRRCDYCDFATWTDKQNLVEEYIDTIIRQWKYHSQAVEKDSEVVSIFFGGGTPNLIDAKNLARIIDEISKVAKVTSETEITVESNPDHVNEEKLGIYADAGVNRISLGIQSTNSSVLEFIGREHKPDHVKKSVDLVRASGIENINGDLIYGSPIETLEQWSRTLLEAVALDLSHISAYSLGIEQGTPLGISVANGEKPNVDEDDLADKYELADEILSVSNYEWYEISNWSRPGFESKHNLSYWRGGEVIALGCAAHGFTNSNRWSTPRHIDAYLDKFSAVRTSKPIDSNMFIDQNSNEVISRAQEIFALKLRTKQGIDWPNFEGSKSLLHLVDNGFIDLNKNESRISLSLKGRLMANRLAVELFEEYGQLMSVVE